MKDNLILLSLIFITVLGISISSVASADEPSIVSVNTNPINPEPASTVTVTANISGDDITLVKLSVSECESKFKTCIKFHLIEMERNIDGLYEATFTLKDKNDSTHYIEYKFIVISNDNTYNMPGSYKVNLSIEPGNDTPNGDDDSTSTNDDNGEDKGIPGFEVFSLLMALIISIFFYKRMRLR